MPQPLFRHALYAALMLVAVLWLIKIIETVLSLDFYQWGVLPRQFQGLWGILFAPLIHGSWEHLVGNTLPMTLLCSLLFYGYPKSRWVALLGIWILSGLGVWLFARSSYHFGASGLTHGVFFYLFVGGILRSDRRSAVLLMVAFYMYGSMVISIFPTDPGISFESHFFGALSGAGLAWRFRRQP